MNVDCLCSEQHSKLISIQPRAILQSYATYYPEDPGIVCIRAQSPKTMTNMVASHVICCVHCRLSKRLSYPNIEYVT